MSEPVSDAANGRSSGKSAGAFRTISEVANDLDVAQHVLRFWESKFPQVKPLKRGGGRRYYRPEDVDLLRQIRSLLYEEGYTIKGVQKLLRVRRGRDDPPPLSGDGHEELPANEASADVVDETTDDGLAERLRALRADLVSLRTLLRPSSE